MTYEELLNEADIAGLIVKEKPLQSSDERIFGNRIAVRKNIPTLKEKSCVLAEELGHYYTTVGNIIDMQDIRNVKQERKARVWAYDELIGLTGLIRAFERCCQSRYEIADFLGVTEEFLSDALNYYKVKYGESTVIDHYIIRFIPSLMVAKMF